ncbi:MAG: hypothetical protein Alpg2KO_07600 [Alphaproteobacteria bacterium]
MSKPPVRPAFVIGIIALSVVVLAGGWLISSLRGGEDKETEEHRAIQAAVDGSKKKMREMAFKLGQAGIEAPFGPTTVSAALDNTRVKRAFRTQKISDDSFHLSNNRFDELLDIPPTFEITRSDSALVHVTYRYDRIDDEACTAVLRLSPTVTKFSHPQFDRHLRARYGDNTGLYFQLCATRGDQRLEVEEVLRLRNY